MRYEFDWSDLMAEDFHSMEWVQLGDHDRKVLNDLYEGYEDCTQWLVVQTAEVLLLVLCAEDKSSPDEEPFQVYRPEYGVVDFGATVQQLRDDSYYEDVE